MRCLLAPVASNLSGCGILDTDFADLISCFESAGQETTEIIYLTDNSLTTVPVELFGGLDALQALYLGGNPLTALPAGLFEGLGGSLGRLWINGSSKLSSLPENLFDGLESLQHLYLHNNALSSLPALPSLPALEILDLRENNLVTLPADLFGEGGLQSLLTLNLASNDMQSLPAGLFDGLVALTSLYLANNPLGSLPSGIFDGLQALEILTLTNTSLGTLPSALFDDLASLTVLSLKENSDLECVPSTAGSPSLADDKVLVPAGFDSNSLCSCPGDDVCGDCVAGVDGYICTAGCESTANACVADRECQECRIEANSEEQAEWESCLSSHTSSGSACSTFSSTACCYDELSANDCRENTAFVAYSECIVQAISEEECMSLSCRDAASSTFPAGDGERSGS
ncbi:unnamed protein product, partial [Scytosiphon promiscuus]